MRIVVDTNIVISRYLSPHGTPAQLIQQWEEGAFTLLVSEPILEEYQEVLAYERLRKLHQLSDDEIEQVIVHFRSFAEMVTVEGTLQVIHEDPDDDKFLECAVSGGAGYIVSGDRHLLDLKEYEGIVTLDPASFVMFLQQHDK